MNRISQYLYFTLLLAVVASCKLNEKYERPEFAKSDLYRGVETEDTTSLADVRWKELFQDTTLQKLIQEGLDNNLNLQIAVARIESAEASLLSAKGALFPSLNVNGSASKSRLASAPSAATGFATQQYQLYGNANWEIDIWGKLRSAKRASLAQLLSSEAYRRAVQTRLIADISTAYFSLLGLDKQLEITELTVESRKKYEETVSSLKEASIVTGADVMQSKANLHAAQVTIPDLKQRIRETENALSVLLNRSPGAIERQALESQVISDSIKTGVPILLLSNRPDVQQAEFTLRSSFEMVKNAHAYFYPSISLTGTAGYNTTVIEQFFDPVSFFARAAGSLTQPIFQQNQNKSRLRAAEASQKEALATYEQTILTAGQEVSDALFSFEVADDKLEIRSQQVEALKNAVSYNEELLQYNSVNYIDVLTSQQNLLTAQLSIVDDQLQKLNSLVELYRALGGGWQYESASNLR